jgi:predicted RNA-binding Zn-ribbon protein involved in translation (DUF1610 family)
MTKLFCNSCGVEIIPSVNDVLFVGKVIEAVTNLVQQGAPKRLKETEVHLCPKCAKKVLKDIIK